MLSYPLLRDAQYTIATLPAVIIVRHSVQTENFVVTEQEQFFKAIFFLLHEPDLSE